MPTISVFRDVLLAKWGSNTLSEQSLEDLCFEFGVELDAVLEDENNETVYKIEVAANRHDLLCVEGIARALGVFKNTLEIPSFKYAPNSNHSQVILVKAETAQIRPYVVGAVLRNIAFDEKALRSFIDLQDKLHHNIGRHRSLVSIGTHDLDTIEGPFVYTALPPNEICFIPLKQTVAMDGDELMSFYEGDMQLKEFLPIIRDSPVYPIIFDNKGTVLSLPPIINGEHSKVTLNTRNIFIECTATDLAKAEIAVNTLVAMFSEYCSPQFTFEPVTISYDSNHSLKGDCEIGFPSLKRNEVEASLNFLKVFTGIKELTVDQSIKLLHRMMIQCRLHPSDPTKLIAFIPINRSDILHQCDLAEDIAIAYGYNNIIPKKFSLVTHVALNSLSNQMRNCIAANGYAECLNWGLSSIKETFDYLQRHLDLLDKAAAQDEYAPYASPVRILSPKTKDFEIVRTTLIPGLLRALNANKGKELPIKLFEIGDVAIIDYASENGSINKRNCCFLYSNRNSSGLEEIHGTLDNLLERFQFYSDYTIDESRNKKLPMLENERPFYTLLPSQDPAFLPKRQVYIRVEPIGMNIGIMGVLHPSVLKAFGISMPVSLAELNVEYLLKWVEATDLYED